MVKSKYPRNNNIFVDVDGTLLVDGKLNTVAVEYLRGRASDGVELVLWSSRGEEYAREFADRFGISGMFKYILGKPGQVLDDVGVGWVRFIEVLNLIMINRG
jgi:hydroxymethylpyrimidine pyrophosphatase-like HAD family hydrolase